MAKRKVGRVSRVADRVAEWLFPDPDVELDVELKSLVEGDEKPPDKKTPPKG